MTRSAGRSPFSSVFSSIRSRPSWRHPRQRNSRPRAATTGRSVPEAMLLEVVDQRVAAVRDVPAHGAARTLAVGGRERVPDLAMLLDVQHPCLPGRERRAPDVVLREIALKRAAELRELLVAGGVEDHRVE